MALARSRLSIGSVVPVALALGSCAVNPATGAREFSLISEAQEIRMGRDADQEITASLGVYEDPSLGRYVTEVGLRLTAASERPSLPWSFKVLDDAVVNAFALPGGYLFVTRGILAHLSSEAELAGVLGHEIGHVTAKHTVSRMSRQQLQQVGLGVGMILSDDIRGLGGVLQTGLGLLNLKYGRGDETQSDELGVRYMSRAGYDPRELVGVFRTLALISGGPDGRIPQWRSTHPYPENREAHIVEVIAATGQDFFGSRVGGEEYLHRLDGLVFGANPREGYFEGSAFMHPQLRFRMVFPDGWVTLNRRSQVLAVAEDQQSLVVLTLASGSDARLALDDFSSQEGIRLGREWDARIHGLEAARAEFRVDAPDGTLSGEVAFIELADQLYQIVGYGTSSGWRQAADRVRATIESFREETDRGVLTVQPWRIEIVTLPRVMTGSEFIRAYPSVVSSADVYRINRMEGATRLGRGRLMKRVIGRRRP